MKFVIKEVAVVAFDLQPLCKFIYNICFAQINKRVFINNIAVFQNRNNIS